MKHLNNENEIKNSKKVGCLYCHSVFNSYELDYLEDCFISVLETLTYCPKCGVSGKLIGDASGIELTETNLKLISYELFKK